MPGSASIAQVAAVPERAPAAVPTRPQTRVRARLLTWAQAPTQALAQALAQAPVLAAACYLAAAVVVTIRLWRDPASRIVAGNPGDADQFAFFMRYSATAIAHFRLPALVTAAMNAPQGINLMWNPSLLLPSVALAPVTLLAGPQVSLTVLLTAGFAGSAFAMFWVLSRWGAGPAAAFAGGLIYGFSPALTHSAVGHYDLQFAVFPPLIADAALSLLTGRTGPAGTGRSRPVRCGIWLGALAAAELLTDEELLFDTVAAVLILTVALAASRPRAVAGRLADVAAGAGACAATVAVLAGYPLWTQFFGSLRQSGSPFAVDFFKNDLDTFVRPSALMLVHSRSSAAFAAAFPPGLPEYVGYLGWPLLGALLAATVVFWRVPAVRVMAVVFVVLEVFSLGGTLLTGGHDHAWFKLPWYWLQTLPVAGSVLPGRFSIIADAAAAAVVAFGLDAVCRRWPSEPARYAACLVAAAVLTPLIPAPLPATSAPAVPAGWTTALRDLRLPEGARVLTVPVPTATLTAPMRWQAATGTPDSLVGGYFIGPAWDGRGYVGGNGPGPEAGYLNQLWQQTTSTGPAPTVTQMLQQIAAWNPAAVVAVTSLGSALGRYLTGLLGPPTVTAAGVLGWRLTLGP
jgi:hypothetical protein